MKDRIRKVDVLVIGTGAAGLAAAVRLNALGVADVAVYSEGLDAGTSINTGSDKQTYYKLGLDGASPDSPVLMAHDLAAGGAVHGDIALVEAALSATAFSSLVSLGVEFPHDAWGRFTGYRTDHDEHCRATSAGPYTSRDMCRALIGEAKRRGIVVCENQVAVELLSETQEGTRPVRVTGAVFLNALTGEMETVLAPAIVFAVGGPGGLYGRSVYPECHTGGIGLALQIGAEARNLAESQYGLASTAFRWNVSGSYMQTLPRVFSLDEEGVEREFLSECFGSVNAASSALFLKGYQWPFSAGNARGSSLVDLFVYKETVLMGRKVFLDYRKNACGFSLAGLSEEARQYLENCQAAMEESPYARLEAMNPGAIQLYRDHGIDLASEPLEVAVSAQHNNGGLAADLWWQSTNVEGLFPIGEVNGSHGVVRPGGSALNAGQVGAWRAAEYIARAPRDSMDEKGWRAAWEKAEKAMERIREQMGKPATETWRAVRARLQARMDLAGAFLRRKDVLEPAILEGWEEVRKAQAEGLGGCDVYDTVEMLRNRSLLLAHAVYLEACRVQLERSGSRGGAIAMDPEGERLSPLLDEEWRILPERTEARGEVTVCSVEASGKVVFRFEACRPVPEERGWFETVWRVYRESAIYGGEGGARG